ncbi:L-aspartate oxidase [Stanieria cyanosphaera PCC 7437]|uniref:L-aspartate oxidase n=1 Tax=Stanieria cyanosphaera (strain ATCC 29371 / PCC 7437) TaxID=111780 RepID=K9XS77_STAC7|nr:L-aspartate oxidase [Stanieria cyanosphaera]AFZ35455.1 L-aspartate oxidase [Stanieria cyanosphaera PCC 7437]
MKDFFFDVVVIGSGAAGLYAALCLPEEYRVALVTKDELKTGASDWAQGGIAAAINPDDSPLLHLEDTLKAGAGLCDRTAVQFLVENAASSIQSLVAMGVAFDRHNNHLAMTLEAAHSRPRVLHAADTTGRAIVSTLTEQVLQRANIEVFAQAFALSLWLHPDTGDCQGISLLHQGEINWLQAAAVVLATGGGGQVFAHTTNPTVSTGDGVALAWRSGAILRDLEFVQFHPTALSKPGAPRFLISEAVRGEGAHLIDSQGKRFAFDYHPDGELAPRDVVSRAIFTHLQKTNQTNVYLDLRPIPVERIRYRFPNIIRVCQKWGVDLFQEPIPVTPAAHYWMGGIAVDTMNQTSIPGLYAIGETASTGVHGANRLASNSLLECLVYAAQLSKLVINHTTPLPKSEVLKVIEEDWQGQCNVVVTIREKLPDLVWQSAGICRTQEIMTSAIALIESWRTQLASLSFNQYVEKLSPCDRVKLISPNAEQQLRLYTETLNLLDIAYLILKSAIFRTESRGGHYRDDYPEPDAHWQVHTMVQQDSWYTASLD